MWINVKDQLPKQNVNVLFQGTCQGMYVGQYQGYKKDGDIYFQIWQGIRYVPVKCIAWQYLPIPYEED